VVKPPFRTVRHNRGLKSSKDAIANEEHVWARTVNTASGLQQISRNAFRAQYDGDASALSDGDDGAILLVPLLIRSPGIFARYLVQVTNDW
jgi:hypothetical protein